ncbi:MAG: hypothetical protein M1490_01480 [Candidatus Bathyarchaeota archaeon]|nr:hypothetical protein [Candidatus Bathyarchaeota archaeon]
MNKQKIILLTLCFLVVLPIVSTAYADTPASAASINAKDNAAGTGPAISECQVGTTLWLFWTQSPSTDTTVEIKIYAPDGTLVHDVANLHQSDSGTDLLKFTAAQTGIYYIVVLGAYNVVIGSELIAAQTILVLPESQFGGLALATAVFAAFGAFSVYKTRHKKSVIIPNS